MSKDLTDAQMLEALLEHAIESRWHTPIAVPDGFMPVYKVLPEAHVIKFNIASADPHVPVYDLEKPGVGSFTTTTETVIFSHEFARALFGEGHHEDDEYQPYNWTYHLQQAVISDNPIKYMYEAVFNAR
jgi:hypothetical protein